jgi:hypothetical protein
LMPAMARPPSISARSRCSSATLAPLRLRTSHECVCMIPYACLHACVRAYVCMYACMHVCMCAYVCMHACMYVCVRMYVRVSVCVCMCVCMYVLMCMGVVVVCIMHMCCVCVWL